MDMKSCFIVRVMVEGAERAKRVLASVATSATKAGRQAEGATTVGGYDPTNIRRLWAAREAGRAAFGRGLAGIRAGRAGAGAVTAEQILPSSTLNDINERVGKINQSFSTIKWGAIAYAGYRAAKSLAEQTYKVGKAIMESTESYKQLAITMEAIYGSEAQRKMDWLVQKAKYLPGTVQEFLRGAIQIKMMGGPFGIDIAELRKGKTLLEDLVKLAAIRPERGFFGAMYAYRMAVFGDYWRTMRMQFGISKELIERELGIPKETLTGPMKVRERHEAVRAFLSKTVSDEFIEKARKLGKSAGTALKTQFWLMTKDIGEKSGMYEAVVKSMYDITHFLETYAESSAWEQAIAKLGRPFEAIAEGLSRAAKIGGAALEQGKPISTAIIEGTAAGAKGLGKATMAAAVPYYEAIDKGGSWKAIKGVFNAYGQFFSGVGEEASDVMTQHKITQLEEAGYWKKADIMRKEFEEFKKRRSEGTLKKSGRTKVLSEWWKGITERGDPISEEMLLKIHNELIEAGEKMGGVYKVQIEGIGKPAHTVMLTIPTEQKDKAAKLPARMQVMLDVWKSATTGPMAERGRISEKTFRGMGEELQMAGQKVGGVYEIQLEEIGKKARRTIINIPRSVEELAEIRKMTEETAISGKAPIGYPVHPIPRGTPIGDPLHPIPRGTPVGGFPPYYKPPKEEEKKATISIISLLQEQNKLQQEQNRLTADLVNELTTETEPPVKGKKPEMVEEASTTPAL